MNLSDLSILVTRPDEAGAALSEELRKQGAKVLWFPTIEFESAQLNSLLKDQLRNIEHQDCVIFISQHAVQEFVRNNAYYSLNPKTYLVGVGEKTAALASSLLNQTVQSPKEENSEGLLQLPFFNEVEMKKITIVKGVNGREFLEKELRSRKADVTTLCLYQRVLPKNDPAILLSALKENTIHVILCSSFDTVMNLCKLANGLIGFINIPLVVMSERVKVLSENLGFRNVSVVDARHYDLMQFLAKKKDELCQMNKLK